jgi:hypothetical protein
VRCGPRRTTPAVGPAPSAFLACRLTRSGTPADTKFKNKMSRVIIACDDGGRRSDLAADMVTGLGYNSIVTIEGGITAYLKAFPLTERDKKARVMRVEQQVGIKYGGTGVTSSQTPDDSA